MKMLFSNEWRVRTPEAPKPRRLLDRFVMYCGKAFDRMEARQKRDGQIL